MQTTSSKHTKATTEKRNIKQTQQAGKQVKRTVAQAGKQQAQPRLPQPAKQAANKYGKLPNTARGAALAVLGQVLDEGAYTNLAINKYLRSHPMEAQERRLFTELVYGTVKALGTIDWSLAQCVTRPL